MKEGNVFQQGIDGGSKEKENLVIVGSGPAAWTAALYAARAEVGPLVFAGVNQGGPRGGQLTTTQTVENYPGFPHGVGGSELIQLMEQHARVYETRVLEEDVIDITGDAGQFIIHGTKSRVETRAIILATGASAKRLDIEGDKEFWNRGISACAVCDGALPIFRGKILMVIGGGDSACEEALYLTKFGNIKLVLRGGKFRASKIMQKRVLNNPKIDVTFFHVVEKALGEEFLEKVLLKDVKTGQRREEAVSGLFYAIGHNPNTEFLKSLKDRVELNESGYIVTQESTHTSLDGCFAAGDVTSANVPYRQAITAAAMGCKAALNVERWLEEQS